MKADERRPTSVIHECRRCDELWEMVVALVDGRVVCDILGLMRGTCENVRERAPAFAAARRIAGLGR